MALSKKHARIGNARSKEWVKLTCSKDAPNTMVFNGVLPDQATVRWHPVAGECYSTPHAGEIIVFELFFCRGLGLLAHPFLCDLLWYYGITLCHLTPNSILHITIFINLCESFLGIEPHFNLFCHSLDLGPQKSSATSTWSYGMGWPTSTKPFH